MCALYCGCCVPILTQLKHLLRSVHQHGVDIGTIELMYFVAFLFEYFSCLCFSNIWVGAAFLLYFLGYENQKEMFKLQISLFQYIYMCIVMVGWHEQIFLFKVFCGFSGLIFDFVDKVH